MKPAKQETLDLRESFEELTCPNPGMKKVLLVGACLEKQLNFATGRFKRKLSDNDFSYTGGSFQLLKYRNIPADPKFKITVMNVDAEYGGEDFLVNPPAADIVIVCYVYHGTYQNLENGTPHRVSELHSPEMWKKAIERTGAKAVIVVTGSGFEIASGMIEGDIYQEILCLENDKYVDHAKKLVLLTSDAAQTCEFIPS